jgi:hypothetical protein
MLTKDATTLRKMTVSLTTLRLIKECYSEYNDAQLNGPAHNRQQCRKTTVLSCHRCVINIGVEKISNI